MAKPTVTDLNDTALALLVNAVEKVVIENGGFCKKMDAVREAFEDDSVENELDFSDPKGRGTLGRVTRALKQRKIFKVNASFVRSGMGIYLATAERISRETANSKSKVVKEKPAVKKPPKNEGYLITIGKKSISVAAPIGMVLKLVLPEGLVVTRQKFDLDLEDDTTKKKK